MLFDRICRENGIRHLLTAPRSPTTTGKIERFHQTMRAEFFTDTDRGYATIAEAQAALDDWVVEYNTERPHQSLGMRPPAERFALALAGPDPQVVNPIVAIATHTQTPIHRPDLRHAGVQRWVDQRGRIRLAGFGYRVPIVLAGEPVEAVVADNLVQIYHHDVLVASHVPVPPPSRSVRWVTGSGPGPSWGGAAMARRTGAAAMRHAIGRFHLNRRGSSWRVPERCWRMANLLRGRLTPAVLFDPAELAAAGSPLAAQSPSLWYRRDRLEPSLSTGFAEPPGGAQSGHAATVLRECYVELDRATMDPAAPIHACTSGWVLRERVRPCAHDTGHHGRRASAVTGNGNKHVKARQ